MAGIATHLGVDVEDLDFAGITFYQGSEFPIAKEFDVGYVELSSVRGERVRFVLLRRQQCMMARDVIVALLPNSVFRAGSYTLCLRNLSRYKTKQSTDEAPSAYDVALACRCSKTLKTVT